MKKYNYLVVLLLILGLVLISACAEKEAKVSEELEKSPIESENKERSENVIRLTNGEWVPWLSENLKHYGLASHIVNEAFALEGIEVEYGFFPWTRAYEIAKEGDWDGSLLWSLTDERAEEFYFSDAVLNAETVFFYVEGTDFDWAQIDDLKNYKIGLTASYAYQGLDEFVEEKGLIVETAPSDEMNLEKLLNNRIDIFPLDRDIAMEMIRENFSLAEQAKFKYHEKPLNQKSYHLILSKAVFADETMINTFNKGLAKLKESGKYEQFIQDSTEGKYLQ